MQQDRNRGTPLDGNPATSEAGTKHEPMVNRMDQFKCGRTGKDSTMSKLLDALYLVVLMICSPVLIARAWRRRKYRNGWPEKLAGKAPRQDSQRPRIWFHAVSAGEVMALRPIVRELRRRRPQWDIVISTTTVTGLDMARSTFDDLITFYAPLDFSWSVRSAVARIRPTVLALVELEIWPNWIAAAKQAGARVVVLNGRLTERSHRGYSRIRGLLGPTMRRIDLVAAQDELIAERFRSLGVPKERVMVTGSVKYDGVETDRANSKTIDLRRRLGLSPMDLIFVAGSTMEGEDEAALAAYQAARREHSQLRLILVPRHPERSDEIASRMERAGERVFRLSKQTSGVRADDSSVIILIDRMGELGAAWGMADVAFVGGSLFPGRNGQNMMEPAAMGASVMFGPHTSNFREAAEGLIARNAARRVADTAALTQALLADLADPEAAEQRGAAARAFVLAQQGATERTLGYLERFFDKPPPDAPHSSRTSHAIFAA
jgi:3-deoxy-D-manno-octulosonic-acid transferase